MKAQRVYVQAWMTVQWLATIPLAAAISYLFYSDVHGLPTAEFYALSFVIIGVTTIGYIAALRALRSWRESA